MTQELKLHEFLKENILSAISKNHNFTPSCLNYLEETENDLMLTLAFVNSTKEFMVRIKELQINKQEEIEI
mgnify:CR=1 FL=1